MKNEFLYNYDWNPNSTTKTYHEDKWEVFQKLIKESKDFFEDKTDYNFKAQLKTQSIYLALNTVCEILTNEKELKKCYEKVRKVLESKELNDAFKEYKIPNVSIKLKIMLILYKFKCSLLISLMRK